MTAHRNIITVDGHQVAILGKVGVINKYKISQYRNQFAKELDIAYSGVGCVFQKPKDGLMIWQP